MANIRDDKELSASDEAKEATTATAPAGVDDAGAIPKGHIDPVYEAKARVLNHAVCLPTLFTYPLP